MKKRLVVFLSVLAVVTMVLAGTSRASTYYMWDTYGSTWTDAQKSSLDPEDDELCWAAATANVLLWTGWANVAAPPAYNFSNAQSIFQYYIDHWTDLGGNAYFGIEWWFTGANSSQGWAGWSQVDVPGGGFWSEQEFDDNIYWDNAQSQLANAAWAMDLGMGVALSIGGDGWGHAITAWGYDYTETAQGNILDGIWFTESDMSGAWDGLQYMSIKGWSDAAGYWVGHMLGMDVYIKEVLALDRILEESQPVPEPATFLLLAMGLLGIMAWRRQAC